MTEFRRYSRTVPPAEASSSERVQTINRLFGLGLHRIPREILRDVPVPTSGLTLIVGQSGSGKSTLLSLLVKDHANASFLPGVEDGETPLVDLIKASTSECIRWLGHFGLGEARIMTTPFRCLSDGQKMRTRLALLMWQRPSCVVIDEFLSLLDRLTAKIVAFNFQKVCRRLGTTAYLASAHEDLIAPLAPDFLVELDLTGTGSVTAYRESFEPTIPELQAVSFGDGRPTDYRALARYHYAEHLASEGPLSDDDWQHSISQIRVARFRGQPIGVALCSKPVPDVLEKIPFFRALNERAVVILRVIVHPTFRGVGLTRQLLAPTVNSSTRAIVACSALGVHFPFFLGAGFRELPHPRNKRFAEHDDLEQLIRSVGRSDLESLHRYAEAQQFYDNLPPVRQIELRRVVEAISVRYNVDYCLFFARLVGISSGDGDCSAELQHLFMQLAEAVPQDQFGTMVSEALYLPVQGFLKMVNDYPEPSLPAG